MKKLLTILGAASLIATAPITVVACSKSDPLANWSLDKLNEHLKSFYSEVEKLEKENEESNKKNNTDYPSAWVNPALQSRMEKTVFEVYSLFADVFLETDYTLNIKASAPELVFKLSSDIETNIYFQELIKALNDFIEYQFKDKEAYVKTFKDYIKKLSAKLEKKNELSKLSLDKLNQKLDEFKKFIKELNDGSEKNEILFRQTYSELFVFMAKVFLETDYVVAFNTGHLDDLKIAQEKDETKYQALLKECIDTLNGVLQDPNDETPISFDYVEIIKDYLLKLENKLGDN